MSPLFFGLISSLYAHDSNQNNCNIIQSSISTRNIGQNCEILNYFVDNQVKININIADLQGIHSLKIINITSNQETLTIAKLSLQRTNVEQIILPKNVNVIVEDNAIEGDSLKKINIFEKHKIDIKNLFNKCPKINYLDVDNSCNTIFKSLEDNGKSSQIYYLGMIDTNFNFNTEFLDSEYSNLKKIHCINSELNFNIGKSESRTLEEIIINNQYTIDAKQIYNDFQELSHFRISRDYQGFLKGNSDGGATYYFVNNSDSFGSVKIDDESKPISVVIYQLKNKLLDSFPGEYEFENLIIKMTTFNISLQNNTYKLNIKNFLIENSFKLNIFANSFHKNDTIENLKIEGEQMIIWNFAFIRTTINKVTLPTKFTIENRTVYGNYIYYFGFLQCNIREFISNNNYTLYSLDHLLSFCPNISRILGWYNDCYLYDNKNPQVVYERLIVWDKTLDFKLSELNAQNLKRLLILQYNSYDLSYENNNNINVLEIFDTTATISKTFNSMLQNYQNLKELFLWINTTNLTIDSDAIIHNKFTNLTIRNPIFTKEPLHINFSKNSIQSNSLKYIHISNSIDLNFGNLFGNCPNIVYMYYGSFKDVIVFNNSDLDIPTDFFKKSNYTIEALKLVNSNLKLTMNSETISDIKSNFSLIINNRDKINLTQFINDDKSECKFTFPKEYKGCFEVATDKHVKFVIHNVTSFNDVKIPKHGLLSIFVEKAPNSEMISPIQFIDKNGVTIKKFEIKSVSQIGVQAFQNIEEIEDLIFMGDEPLNIIDSSATIKPTIHNIYFSSSHLTLGKNLFEGRVINKICLPNTVAIINDETFKNCQINNFTISNGTSINLAAFFNNNPSIKQVYGWYRNHYIYEEEKVIPSNKIVFTNKNSLQNGFPISDDITFEDVIFANSIAKDNILKSKTFKNNHKIKQLTFNYPIKTIQSAAISSLQCIEKITFYDFPGSRLTVEVNAFSNSLKTIELPSNSNFDISNIISNCGSLETFKALPLYVTTYNDIIDKNIIISSTHFMMSDIKNSEKYHELESIDILLNKEDKIMSNSFSNMNNLKKLNLSQTKIKSIEENAFSNIDSIIDIIFPTTLSSFSKNSFINVKINEFYVLNQYKLSNMSFNKCSFNSIIIGQDVQKFSVGPFYKCGNTLNINYSLNERFSLNSYGYLVYNEPSNNRLLLDESSSNNDELIFVPGQSNFILNITEKYVEPYALSYCHGYTILTNTNSLESVKGICHGGGNDSDIILSSNPSSYDYKYFICNSNFCKMNCLGNNHPIRTQHQTPTKLPETVNIGKETVPQPSPILSINQEGKTMQMVSSYAKIVTQVESETSTHQVTITETKSSLTTTYYLTLTLTWINTESIVLTNIWVDYDSPGSSLSPGQIIFLCAGLLLVVLVLSMLGIYLYRRSKENSDDLDSSSSFVAMEENIGFVINPNDGSPQLETNNNGIMNDMTYEDPVSISFSSDSDKDYSVSSSFLNGDNTHCDVVRINI